METHLFFLKRYLVFSLRERKNTSHVNVLHDTDTVREPSEEQCMNFQYFSQRELERETEADRRRRQNWMIASKKE